MLLTNSDLAQRRKYEEAESRRLGNLHERMKLVMALYREQDGFDPALREALFDLEYEVAFYTPADPPFATRTFPLSKENDRA